MMPLNLDDPITRAQIAQQIEALVGGPAMLNIGSPGDSVLPALADRFDPTKKRRLLEEGLGTITPQAATGAGWGSSPAPFEVLGLRGSDYGAVPVGGERAGDAVMGKLYAGIGGSEVPESAAGAPQSIGGSAMAGPPQTPPPPNQVTTPGVPGGALRGPGGINPVTGLPIRQGPRERGERRVNFGYAEKPEGAV